MSEAAGQVYDAELPAGRDASAAAVAEVADAWGAQWDREAEAAPGAGGAVGGRLVLPRVAGVHRGVLVGRLELLPLGVATTRAVYQVEEAHDRVHGSAVAILVLSAFGALTTVVWPFWPSLMPVAPFGALLALGGWFLVVSRLQNSGPEEFFHMVEEELGGGDEPEEAPAEVRPT